MKLTKAVIDHQYSLAGVHLPERKILTTRLEKVSFVLNDLVLASAVLTLITWATQITFIKAFLFGFFTFRPLVAFLFILAGCTLLFSAKYYHGFEKKYTANINFITITPLLLGGITSLIGLLSIFNFFGDYSVPPMVGFTFLLLGLAMTLPHVKITHRFHVTQLLSYGIVAMSAITILGYIYQSLSSSFTQPLIPLPLNTAILLFLLCHSILLRWSNRGFFGNFTIDCSSSIYALRLLLINLALTPLVGFIVLAVTQMEHNIYIIMALLVLLLMVVTTILSWFNMKLIYRYELEHFAIKEALRIHNIKLMLDKKTQQVKLSSLEEEKKDYAGKLNNQNKFIDIVDSVS